MAKTPDYTGSKRAAALGLVWCAATLLLASLLVRIPGGAPSPWSPGDTAQAPPLARFDAGWYRTIALQGYAGPDAARFYPLYPILAGGLARFIQVPFFESATVLSCLFTVLAVIVSRRLEGSSQGESAPPSTAAAFLLYPTSFFLAAPTSDSLFVLAVAATIGAARRQRWALAGLAGAAAALTRSYGFLLAAAIALPATPGSRRAIRRDSGRWAAAAAVFFSGTIFPSFIHRRFGDWTLAWGAPEESAAPPWRLPLEIAREAVRRVREPGAGGKLVFVMAAGSLLLFFVLTVFAWRRGDRGGALFAAATLLFLIGRGSLYGVHREVLSLVPGFAALAALGRGRRPLAIVYAVAGITAGLMLMARYVRWISIE